MLDLTDVKGVIFDLDGTLVASSLNFGKMRQDIGCPDQQDILTFIESISCDVEKARANALVLQHELDDARDADILPAGKTMLAQVNEANLPMAIVTRNCRQATDIKLKSNNIAIDLVITREDAPPKPDPTALLQIANQWSLAAEHLLYVGDYLYDKQAAENAGMRWFLV